jgi:hypothetical protein
MYSCHALHLLLRLWAVGVWGERCHCRPGGELVPVGVAFAFAQ